MPTAAATNATSLVDLRVALIENGYRIIPVNGKRPRIKGWSGLNIQAAQVEGYTRRYADHANTGILTGEVVGIDIDALDTGAAEKLIARLMEIPGATSAPCRTGRAPKCLYMFRAIEPRAKLATKEYLIAGRKCQVEVLGVGQQFVAFGNHAETGQPYLWSNGDPLTVGPDNLPSIDLASIDAFREDAEGILATMGEPVKEKAKSSTRNSTTTGDTFWRRVNAAALAQPERWVQPLFPSARREAGTSAWRISSASLGRPLEEDISIHPDGVQDFGLETGTTPIQLVIDFGGAPTPKDAAFWLCDRLGKEPADFGWAISATFSYAADKDPQAANDNQPDAEPARKLPSMPDMHPTPFTPEAAGGLLADISRWITETAIIPVPELSLCSAIALIGGMFGDRALGPTRSGLNMFLTTVMGVASGKGHAPKSIIHLATVAGKPGAVTNGDPTSYAAIERMLRRNSSTVIVMDEFGVTLQDVNNRRANAASASIRKFLLSIYDQADSFFHGRQYASDETKKDDSPLKGPALTVLGMTTPSTLYAGLSDDSLSDGFLSRFVFMEGRGPEIISPPRLDREAKLPKGLKADLERALKSFPAASNPLGINKVTIPFDGHEKGEAYKLWADIFRWQNDPAWNDREHHVNGRAAENAVRLATIRAVSRNPASPTVSAEDVAWGWAIVHRSICIVTEGVDRHMAGSTVEALRKAIVRALEVAKDRTLPWSFLLQREVVSTFKQDDVADALAWLIETGKVADLSGRSKPGPRASFKLVAG